MAGKNKRLKYRTCYGLGEDCKVNKIIVKRVET